MLQLVALLLLGQGLVTQGTAANGNIATNPTYATQAALNLYVDPALGSDANLCTSSGAGACLTVDGARLKVPRFVNDPVTINVAAGTYDAGAYITGFVFGMGARAAANDAGPWLKVVCSYGDAGVAGAQSGGTVSSAVAGNTGVLGSGDPSTWGTVVLSPTGGGSYTNNTLNGYLLRITGGTAVGEAVLISSNTGNTATIIGAWPSTPDNTSTYQVSSWASTFTHTLPNPPGTPNFGYDVTAGSAFYIADNVETGFGAPQHQDKPSRVRTEPQVSVEGCGFNLNTSNEVAVTGGGYVNFAVINSNISSLYGVASYSGANAWVAANNATGGLCNDLYASGGSLSQQWLPDVSVARIFGNLVSTTCGAGLAEIGGGTAYLIQNQVTIPSGCGGSCPLVLLKGSPQVLSSGNIYKNTAVDSTCIETYDQLAGSLLTHFGAFETDGDTFTNCLNEFVVNQDTRVTAFGTASKGSGNTTGFVLKNGARAEFVTAWAASDTTDLTIDGTNWTFATLRAPGAGTQKTITNLNTGTFVHEE